MSLAMDDDVAIFSCNACGETADMAIGTGRPKLWAKLDFEQSDRHLSHDLCPACALAVRDFMKQHTFIPEQG